MKGVLEGTNLAEVIDVSITSNQATALCRVKPQHHKAWAGEGGFYHHLLKNEGQNWKLHLCQNFRLTGVKGASSYVFCWIVSISSVNIVLACQEFLDVARKFNNQTVPAPRQTINPPSPTIMPRRAPKPKTGPELTSPPPIGNPESYYPPEGVPGKARGVRDTSIKRR